MKKMFARTFALVLLMGVAFFAAAEVLLWMNSGSYTSLTAQELWRAVDQPSLERAEILTATNLRREMWDPIALSVLRLPVWSMLAFPAIALLWHATRRPPGRFFKRRPRSRLLVAGGRHRYS